MDEKKIIRNKILSIRNNMSTAEVKEKSLKIIENLKEIKEFKDSNCVSIYLSFNNEVDTTIIVSYLIESGKKIVVPYTETKTVELIPLYINDLNENFKISSFGYSEPIKEKMEEARFEDIDFVIVPGIAFDENKNRVGFGKGYYDKYLSKIKSGVKWVAIAYEYQVLKHVPSESHDIKMKMIVTEKRIIT